MQTLAVKRAAPAPLSAARTAGGRCGSGRSIASVSSVCAGTFVGLAAGCVGWGGPGGPSPGPPGPPGPSGPGPPGPPGPSDPGPSGPAPVETGADTTGVAVCATGVGDRLGRAITGRRLTVGGVAGCCCP